MRRRAHALALAAALLAGCRIDVDGAPCGTPGDAADCPGGQACGNDLRCSARALACAGSRCEPGASVCVSPAAARRCDGADPVCGRWVEDDCAARAMECGTRGSGGCECPEHAATTLVAAPAGSPDAGLPPFPRGQPFPPECRFGKLADALDAAGASTAAVTVSLAGEGAPPVFGPSETGEDRPLVVRPNVTLVPAAATAAISGGAEVREGAAILRVEGAAERLRIEAAGATGTGVSLECGASGGPALRRVAVSGGASLDPSAPVTGLARGVALAGGCGGRVARLEGVEVEGVSGPALYLEPDPAATVTVLGGSFRASATGLHLRGGHVTVGPDPDAAATPVVSGNSGHGVVVCGLGCSTLDVALERVLVEANGGTGIVVSGISGSTARVRLRRCEVHANGGARPGWIGTTSPRFVGGVMVKLDDPRMLAFEGNRLWGNASDQLGLSIVAPWTIGPGACGADSNVFGCVAPGAYAVGVYRGSPAATVAVPFNVWPANYEQLLDPQVAAPKMGEVCDAPLPPCE